MAEAFPQRPIAASSGAENLLTLCLGHASTALVHGMTVVTRNVADFESTRFDCSTRGRGKPKTNSKPILGNIQTFLDGLRKNLAGGILIA